MKLQNNLNLQGFEVQNVKAQVLGTPPSLTATDEGRFWYDSVNNLFKGWDGAVAHTLNNVLESVTASGPLVATPNASTKATALTISPATGSAAGSMSSTDKAKLDAAVTAATPSTLVLRDASGNFSAGTITAALNGLASNATALGGQTLTQVRDFSLTTGVRDYTAISGFDTRVRTAPLNEMAAATGSVSLGNQRIVNLADPAAAQDAATKNYVDSIASGLNTKPAVKLSTAAPLATVDYANGTAGAGATLTGSANGALGLIDGTAPALNDRILVKDQVAAAQNGVYTVTNLGSGSTKFVLTRALDSDQAADLLSAFVFVQSGSTLAGSGWVQATKGAIVIGTDPMVFSQFSGSSTYTANNGVVIGGTVISAVSADTNKITVAGGINIASNYVGQTSITTLGTISTGSWNATTIPINKGGTGQTTAAAARTALAAAGKAVAAWPASGASFVFTHNLNTQDVSVTVLDATTNEVVYFDVVATSLNSVTVTAGSTIAAGAYRVVVIG